MKGNWKRTFAALLGLTTLLTISAGAFSNAPASWAADSIQYLEDYLLFEGLSNSTTRSSTSKITRGEFCQLLVNVARSESDMTVIDAIPPKEADYFSDISYSVTEDAPGGKYDMYYAAAYGLTEGATQGDGVRNALCSTRLTREQAAKMMCSLVTFFEAHSGAGIYEKSTANQFADAGQVSFWARESVELASAYGIMQGDEKGCFNPAQNLTWEEAAVMAARAHQAAMKSREKLDSSRGIRTLKTTIEDIHPEYTVAGYDAFHLLPGGDSVLYLNQPSGPIVEYYDASGNCLSRKQIPMELDSADAFYATDKYYFICFGQENSGENDSKEVYRVVKYDHSWNRLGSSSITGAESYTIHPYHSTTHTGLSANGDLLVLHTARLRYTSKDGLNHQSNFTAKIRISDMKVLETSPEFPDNHVSHSFAQYVAFDGEQVVYADHGDAYPRSFVITAEGDYGGWEPCAQQSIFPFYGAIGDNTTNADPGGLGISGKNYLFLGASAPQKTSGEEESDQNVFLAVVPKSGFPNGQVRLQWLTNFSGGSEWVTAPTLVQMNNNTFVAIWQSMTHAKQSNFYCFGDLYYAVFDGTGKQIGNTVRLKGFMAPSAADPLVEGNTISWVRPDRSTLHHSYAVSDVERLKVYTIELPLNDSTQAQSLSLSLNQNSLSLQTGQSATLTPDASPASGTVTWNSSAPWVAVVQDGTVSARSAGETTITAKLTYQGRSVTATCKVTVSAPSPLTGLTLNRNSLSLKAGERSTLSANVSPAGVGATLSWKSSNTAVASVQQGTVTAHAAGTAVVQCTASLGERSFTASCSVTVSDPPSGQAGEQSGSQAGQGGESDKGQAGNNAWPTGAVSSAPESGFYRSYREAYSNGDYFSVELNEDDQLVLHGVYTIPDNAAHLYNYVVFSATGEKVELPYAPGVPFEATLSPNMEVLRQLCEKGSKSRISLVVCQNYTPGSSGYAGSGLQLASLSLTLDENENCVIEVKLQ